MEKQKKPTHAWGIASLICGILSLFLFLAPYFGFPLAITAIVFQRKQEKIVPTGIATGGLVTGIIGIILNSVVLIIVVGALVFMKVLK